MKLAIIYPDKGGWTVDQFRECAKNRGIVVETIEVTDELLATGEVDARVAGVDAVLWKFADATLAAFLASRSIFEDKPLVNTGVVLMPSATDKFLQQQLFVRSDIARFAVPTYRVKNTDHVTRLVREGRLQYPLIIKPAWGTNARGVHIVHTADDLHKVTSWQSQIAEPFISSDEEWRIFVIGGVTAGIMRKRRRETANPNQTIIGGGARNTAEERREVVDILSDVSEKAAALLHLEYAGVDVVRDSQTGQFYVYEVNSAAGWQNGFADATGEDIPGQVLDWFEERLALQDGNDTQRMSEYLIRRSHRLPYFDELLLVSLLSLAQDNDRIVGRVRELVGVEYETLRKEAQRHLAEKPDDKAFIVVVEAINAICTRQQVTIVQILGEELKTSLLERMRRVTIGSYRTICRGVTSSAVEQDATIVGADERHTSIAVSDIDDWVQRLRFLHGSNQQVPVQQALEQTIATHFSDITLLTLLDFAVAVRKAGRRSYLESMIIDRARKSVSWAGSFLVDQHDTGVGATTVHTMRQAYRQTIMYITLASLISRDR